MHESFALFTACHYHQRKANESPFARVILHWIRLWQMPGNAAKQKSLAVEELIYN